MDKGSFITPWSPGRLISFRLLFIYFAIYIFPFPLTLFSPLNPVSINVWNPLIVWVGDHVLHLQSTITILPNGSGDTTWNYVQVLVIVIFSLVGSLIWSIRDRKKKAYPNLFYWLIVALRYFLGATMLMYGFAKVIPTQFGSPGVDALLRSYGDSSPMGLLWTFMGYSTIYNIFVGGAEVVGGLLLFFARTRLLGALISFIVLSNVVILNFTYDVPVKLFSSHLLLMSLVILLPDLQRLCDFLVLNKVVQPQEIRPAFQSERWNRLLKIAKPLFLAVVLGAQSITTYQAYQFFFMPHHVPLQGVYDVQEHIVNLDTIPRLVNDTRRWKRIVVEWNRFTKKEMASIEYMDSAKLHWSMSADTLAHKISLSQQSSTQHYEFNYVLNGNILKLTGTLGRDSVKVAALVKRDVPLLTRGFHWINETPYYR